MDLVAAVLGGDRLALARLLTRIENETVEGLETLNRLFPHTGKAHLIGVTGAPGTGKSSLVNQLARYYRNPLDGEHPKRVAVVAVDPSSPFSGGSVLGDRIRMRDLSGDPGVFIRSMATRGSLGGLARATAGIVQAFDAANFEIVLIETVGAGQAEVDIARLAHTTLVVEAPGLGDDIQAIKAGILEIADILVVNKADRPGVENTERALKNMLRLAHPAPRVFREPGRNYHRFEPTPVNQPHQEDTIMWVPSIKRTVATDGQGIPALAGAIHQHWEYLQTTGDWERRERARIQNELNLRIQDTLVNRWYQNVPNGKIDAVMDRLVAREISPAEAVEILMLVE